MTDIHRLLLLLCVALTPVLSSAAPEAVPQWGRFEASVTNSRMYADPFRGVSLAASFIAPDGRVVRIRGFHDGGATWKLRFMPGRIGTWRYSAAFSDGAKGAGGSFRCVRGEIPGMISRHEANATWFGFTGGRCVLLRSLHVGDRFFASNSPAARRKAFLDWAQRQGYNMLSVASHYLNRDQPGRGAGWDTPDLWPLKAAEWRKMEAILDDLARRRIVVYPFAGLFGQGSDFPTDQTDQELYVRYVLARIGPYWNVLLNVAGPEPLLKPGSFQNAMGRADVRRLGSLIARLDPFGHLLSVHNPSGDDPFRAEPWTSFVTLQGGKGSDLRKVRSFVAGNRVAGKPIYAQEVFWPGNKHHAHLTDEQVRKKAYVLLLSGATINYADMNGNSSSGYGGSMDPAERVGSRHDILKKVWDFFEATGFAEMTPHQELVSRGTCLARPGRRYLVYLDAGGAVDVAVSPGRYAVEWINACATSDRRRAAATTTGKALTSPDGNDWLLRLVREP